MNLRWSHTSPRPRVYRTAFQDNWLLFALCRQHDLRVMISLWNNSSSPLELIASITSLRVGSMKMYYGCFFNFAKRRWSLDFVVSTAFIILITVKSFFWDIRFYNLTSAKTSVKKLYGSKTFASANLLSFLCTVAWSFDNLIVGMIPFRCWAHTPNFSTSPPMAWTLWSIHLVPLLFTGFTPPPYISNWSIRSLYKLLNLPYCFEDFIYK